MKCWFLGVLLGVSVVLMASLPALTNRPGARAMTFQSLKEVMQATGGQITGEAGGEVTITTRNGSSPELAQSLARDLQARFGGLIRVCDASGKVLASCGTPGENASAP